MTITTPTLHSRLSGENGQSMVEFAVVLPILAMLFLAIWQVGVAFHNYLALTDAARVGARAAIVNAATPTGSCQAAKNAIQQTVSATQWSAISSRITCTPGTPATPDDMHPPYQISISWPYTITVFFNRNFTMTASATERIE